MKKSDSIVLTTLGIGVVAGVGIWIAWPNSPWYIYAVIAAGTMLAIPKNLKHEAELKAAKKLLDE